MAESLGRPISSGNREFPEGTSTQNQDTSINIEIEFGDGYTFNSITGRSAYEYQDGIDADFLPVSFIGRTDFSEYEQLSQEFRVSSDPSKRFSFITGVYWETQTQEIDRLVAFDGTLGQPAFLTAAAGAPSILAISQDSLNQLAGIGFSADGQGTPFSAGVPGLSFFNQAARLSNWVQETDAYAVFFQGEYRINDAWTIIGGLRYTSEDKTSDASVRLTSDTLGLGTTISGPNATILELILDGAGLPTEPHDFVGERDTDQLLPAVTLEWDQSDSNLYYLTYSEGFKSGGFNSVDDQAGLDTSPFDPRRVNGISVTPGVGFEYGDETAYSIELGGKHTLLDGSMTINWAAFTSQYDDQQVSTFVGVGFVVANAASSEVNGIEADIRWQAMIIYSLV